MDSVNYFEHSGNPDFQGFGVINGFKENDLFTFFVYFIFIKFSLLHLAHFS